MTAPLTLVSAGTMSATWGETAVNATPMLSTRSVVIAVESGSAFVMSRKSLHIDRRLSAKCSICSIDDVVC